MKTEKFNNKYRIPSARAQWWDYGWNAAYYVTICTKDREHLFGEINNKKMIVNRLGVIAYIIWHEIPFHSKNVELGEFVVMPNHIHGIVHIMNPKTKNDGIVDDKIGNIVDAVVPGKSRYQNIGKHTLSSIIGSYKSAVTKYANRLEIKNGWQRLFHDVIIKTDTEYKHITDYIIKNPENWTEDRFNTSK